MNWSIVTDSSCDVENGLSTAAIPVSKVPFTISIGKKDYVDDENIDTAELIKDMSDSPEASKTACPAPGAWYDCFLKADNVIAITISSKLSGSYQSALAAKEMILEDFPYKNIHVLDSQSAGPGLNMLVRKAKEYIEKNLSFETITECIEKQVKEIRTIFVLNSFDNLVKSGRIGRLTGFIAGKIRMSGIGFGDNGVIAVKQKVIGTHRVIKGLIDDLIENGYKEGEIIISHCHNLELAENMAKVIKGRWDSAKITILKTGGLCSYYAENKGLIMCYDLK
ncbi:MAG: DegV family protein [Lachnospiraceae bacterium]|nr:DegV family protein [Lachnospiraceae bacterium]